MAQSIPFEGSGVNWPQLEKNVADPTLIGRPLDVD